MRDLHAPDRFGSKHMQLDSTLNRLCDSLGACERTKNTVFPR